MKRAIMQIIIHSDRDEDYLAFKKDLHIILEHGVTDFSLSPLRTDTMKTGYGEMYMTLNDFCQIMLMLVAFAGFLWSLWTYWNKRK